MYENIRVPPLGSPRMESNVPGYEITVLIIHLLENAHFAYVIY